MKKVIFVLLLFISANMYARDIVEIKCVGGETGKFLSHANGTVSLQDGCRGEGELFILRSRKDKEQTYVSLECCGGEKGMFLSHANGVACLQNGCMGDGEIWVFSGPNYINDYKIRIQAIGGEFAFYLSHANGIVSTSRIGGLRLTV